MSSPPGSISTVLVRPSRLGTLGPCRSTSRMPTLKPRRARAAAVLTVTELLPTPPLPLMTKSLCRICPSLSAMILSCRATGSLHFPSPPLPVALGQEEDEEQEEQEAMTSPCF